MGDIKKGDSVFVLGKCVGKKIFKKTYKIELENTRKQCWLSDKDIRVIPENTTCYDCSNADEYGEYSKESCDYNDRYRSNGECWNFDYIQRPYPGKELEELKKQIKILKEKPWLNCFLLEHTPNNKQGS